MINVSRDVEISAETLTLLYVLIIIEFKMSDYLEWALFQEEDYFLEDNHKATNVVPEIKRDRGEQWKLSQMRSDLSSTLLAKYIPNADTFITIYTDQGTASRHFANSDRMALSDALFDVVNIS